MADARTVQPFWEFLAEWLHAHEWTQTQLADTIGVHQTVVSKWLHADIRRRARPGRQTMAKLSEVLAVPLDQLLLMLLADQSAAEEARETAKAIRSSPTSGDDTADEDMAISATMAEMREILRGLPRVYWGTVLKAFSRGVEGARDMAQLLTEHSSTPSTHSTSAHSGLSTPKRSTNSRKRSDDEELAKSYPMLQVGRRPALAGV